MTETMGVTPVYSLDGNKDNNMMGGGFMWVFFLFFLLAWGGNGLGGFGGANAATNQINNDFIYSNLSNQIGRNADQVQNGFAGLNSGLCNLGYTNLSNFKDMQAQMSQCCCETNRNIDAVRYENARNTCDIIQASEKNADRILAYLNAADTQRLRDELQTAQIALSNASQTTNIINAVRPFPAPCYVTCSPYTSPCDNGCGLC